MHTCSEYTRKLYFYLCSKHFYLLLYQQEAISRRLSDATTEQSSNDDSAKVQPKVSPSSPASSTWNNTESMYQTVELAKALWREMHMWFLNFVNEALDVGFHLFEDQNMASKGKHSSHITVVLSQSKKISYWLDGVGKIAEEEKTKEKIECLKRKIYGFVISHMGSAFESSVSVSSRS